MRTWVGSIAATSGRGESVIKPALAARQQRPDKLAAGFGRAVESGQQVGSDGMEEVVGVERQVVDTPSLLRDEAEIPAAERARRERMRETTAGITAFTADRAIAVAAFSLDGILHCVDLTTPGATPVALSADGTIALSGGWDHSVRIWRTQTGQCLRVLSHQGDCVSAVAIAPRAGLGASGSWDGAIVLFDLETGTVRARLAGTVGAVTALRFTRDGAFVVSAGSDGIVRLWRAATGELELVITGHVGAIYALDSTADSRFLVTAGADGSARMIQLDYTYDCSDG